jgi:hypothetical protein
MQPEPRAPRGGGRRNELRGDRFPDQQVSSQAATCGLASVSRNPVLSSSSSRAS